MTVISQSAGKIVKQLLANKGPMTTQSFYQFVPTYEKEFISKTHLKTKILKSMESEGVIYKAIKRDPASPKPTWEWNFKNPADIEKYKNL